MVKLNLNKTSLVALLCFLILSCSTSSKSDNEPLNTEILCPNLNQKILVRNIASDDFLEALNKFDDDRKKRESNEDYTAVVFRNKTSMHFKGIKSEELLQCTIRNVRRDQLSEDYLIYY